MTAPEPEQLPMFTDTLQEGEYIIPTGIKATKCRTCGADIVFTRTGAGKSIPLSLATERSCGGQRVAKTHFIDCPDSRGWRKQ